MAFERGIVPFPAGAAGTNIARLPPVPGLFVLQQFSYAEAQDLYGDDGKKLPVPFHTTVTAATTRLLASYPVKPFGAQLYSQLVLPVTSLKSNVAGVTATQTALTNVTLTPAILKWTATDRLTVVAALDLTLESGAYRTPRPSVAFGYASAQPLVALRYSDPQGLDLAISNRLAINGRNGDTDYRSGSAYIGEFAAGWNTGPWKLGVVGAYVNQYTDDKSHGAVAPPNGNRGRSLAVGPSVVYDFGKVNLNVNYQPGVYAVNTSKIDRVWVNLAFRLY
ncbi:SphA family protein [Roseateles sp. L2-2]